MHGIKKKSAEKLRNMRFLCTFLFMLCELTEEKEGKVKLLKQKLEQFWRA